MKTSSEVNLHDKVHVIMKFTLHTVLSLLNISCKLTTSIRIFHSPFWYNAGMPLNVSGSFYYYNEKEMFTGNSSFRLCKVCAVYRLHASINTVLVEGNQCSMQLASLSFQPLTIRPKLW